MRYIVIIFAIFFLGHPAKARETRHIAIIDTEFCRDHIHIPKQLKDKIIIHPASSSTHTCGKIIPKERWAHGHHVLNLFTQELAKQFPSNLMLEIHPYNIFDSAGSYTLKNWEDMLKGLMQISPDVILMASTYYGPDHSTLEQSVKNFHGIFLLAAGAIDETIQKSNFLWPQASKTVKKIIFGSYIHYQNQGQKGAAWGQLDTHLIEQNGLDLVVQTPKMTVYPTGSSYAVARAAGFVLSRCPTFELASFLACIEGLGHQILLKSPLFQTGKIYKGLNFSK